MYAGASESISMSIKLLNQLIDRPNCKQQHTLASNNPNIKQSIKIHSCV